MFKTLYIIWINFSFLEKNLASVKKIKIFERIQST